MDHAHGTSFSTWLSAHRQQEHITKLLCQSDDRNLLFQFPACWPKLQELILTGARVWGPAKEEEEEEEWQEHLSCFPKLTKLILSHWHMEDEHQTELLRATGLLHLSIVSPVSPEGQNLCLAAHFLEALSSLTHLSLHDLSSHSKSPMLQHISRLVNLQELDIASMQNLVLDPTQTPNLSSLTALTRLNLEKGSMDPTVLTESTQLRHLSLQEVVLRTPDPTTAAATLLSCIARMPGLQHLELCPRKFKWPADASAYTALTGNCCELQHLQLAATLGRTQPPEGIWAAMFPAGRIWPELKVLCCPVRVGANHTLVPDCALTADEVARLVSCCPSLRECELRVRDAVELSPLAALTALTSLSVAAPSNTALSSMAKLQSLRRLKMDVRKRLNSFWLVELTGLQALELLEASAPDTLGQEMNSAFNFHFSSEAGEDASSPSPVWLRLQQHCADYRACHPYLLRSLFKRLDDQRLDMEQLQQQRLAERCDAKIQRQQAQQRQQQLEQQVAQLQQRVQELEQRDEVSVARSEAAAARSAANELGSRVQALEAAS